MVSTRGLSWQIWSEKCLISFKFEIQFHKYHMKIIFLYLTISYDVAFGQKSNLLAIIHSLNLPNNPLDDIIDQVSVIF